MADLSFNPASVKLLQGEEGWARASVAINAGQLIGVNVFTLAADLSGALASGLRIKGIALTSAAIGQPVAFAKPGSLIDLGIVLTAGSLFVVSRTPGQISPLADQGLGDRVIIAGWGTAAGKFYFGLRDLQVNAAGGDDPWLHEDGDQFLWEDGEPAFFN